MRAQNSGGLARLQRAEHRLREREEPVRVDHERARAAHRELAHELLHVRLATDPRTERNGVALAGEQQQRSERGAREAALGAVRQRRGHHLGALHLEDLVETGRACDRDQARADARGAVGRQRRCARLAARSRDDQGVSEAALVRAGGSRRERAARRRRASTVRRRAIRRAPRRRCRCARRRCARRASGPGSCASPSFGSPIVTVTSACTATPCTWPGVGVEPRRQVHRDDARRRPRRVDPADRRCRRSLDGAIEAGAEERVDEHGGVRSARALSSRSRRRACSRRAALAAASPRRARRSPTSTHAHRHTEQMQMTRDDEAVAAVVAGAADDEHGPRGATRARRAPPRRRRDRRSPSAARPERRARRCVWRSSARIDAAPTSGQIPCFTVSSPWNPRSRLWRDRGPHASSARSSRRARSIPTRSARATSARPTTTRSTVGAACSERPHAPRFEPTGDADRQPQLGGEASGIAEAFERRGPLGLRQIDGSRRSRVRHPRSRLPRASFTDSGSGAMRTHTGMAASRSARAAGGSAWRRAAASSGAASRRDCVGSLASTTRSGRSSERQLQQRRGRREAQLELPHHAAHVVQVVSRDTGRSASLAERRTASAPAHLGCQRDRGEPRLAPTPDLPERGSGVETGD